MRTCNSCGFSSDSGSVCKSCQIRNAAFARLNAVTRHNNAEIERGNRRRTRCLESIVEWCMKGDLVRARVWVMKLAAAGFEGRSIVDMQAMSIGDLERCCRQVLCIPQRSMMPDVPA